MREFTNPPLASAPPVGGLADVVFEYAQEDPTYIALGRKDEASAIYQQGIEVATRRGDQHARRELESALSEISPT